VGRRQWGKSGGLRIGKGKNSMTFKDIMLDDSSLYTGEVVGSIPTAPTILRPV